MAKTAIAHIRLLLRLARTFNGHNKDNLSEIDIKTKWK